MSNEKTKETVLLRVYCDDKFFYIADQHPEIKEGSYLKIEAQPSVGYVDLFKEFPCLFLRGCDRTLDYTPVPKDSIYFSSSLNTEAVTKDLTVQFCNSDTEPKEGDYVLVGLKEHYIKYKRIFLEKLNTKFVQDIYICVNEDDERFYPDDPFDVCGWNYMKPLPRSSYIKYSEEHGMHTWVLVEEGNQTDD